MPNDEDQIRTLVRTWLSATKAGDIDTILDLMTDDVVFLVPGQLPMRKREFAALSQTQTKCHRPTFEADSEIQEIQVSGDLAFVWTKLSIAVTSPGGTHSMKRAGYTLSVLRRESGKWRLARDANLLTPITPSNR
ncbi:SgcJ/EcaC family oxidoreductase [Ferrovibrio sp.]|uniref:YybH family protein n=1 Tax=Ferrovibrio sp. TaxID=1917215 RepID=UPI0026031F29|nr:SgcJ/EcaC family oxidoreductase [Ferrovibrio sp.]